MEKESALFYVVLFLFAVTGIVTILGMIKKVDIEQKYLNGLFSALILELITAVLYIFSNTDFFDKTQKDTFYIARTELPKKYESINKNQLLTILTQNNEYKKEVKKLEKELISLNNIIDAQNPAYHEVLLSLDNKIKEIKQLQTSYESAKKYKHEYLKLEKHFLVRMANLNTKLSVWGTSINLRWRPEEKREIAKMLQDAFKQIGFMSQNEVVNDDPEKTYHLLVAYQKSKNFTETGFLTSEVIAFIIKDYLT